MRYSQSTLFPDSIMITVWESEKDDSKKRSLFGRYSWQTKPYDDFDQFYIEKQKWNKLIKTKSMFKWMLEN